MVLTTAFSAKATPVEVKYEAESVKSTASRKTVNKQYIAETKPYILVGVNKDGYQIWRTIVNLGKLFYTGENYGCEYAVWRIDDGEQISAHTDSFEANTVYNLDQSYANYILRNNRNFQYVCDGFYSNGNSYTHFIKPTSQTTAQFMAYRSGSSYRSQDFAINSHINIKKESVTYDVENKKYRIELSWNLDNVTEIPVESVVFYTQMEGIVSPSTTSVCNRNFATTYIDVPWYIKRVSITAKFTPLERYAVLFPNEVTSDTICHEFLLNDLPCSIKTEDLSSSFDADYGTYNPNVEWTCQEGYENVFDRVNIDYSVDNGATWKHGLTTNKGAGTGKLYNIMPGYSKYIFRYNGVADSWLHAGDAINITAYDTIKMNYSPQITRLELVGNITDNYNEQTGTFKPSVAYSINRDLYEMSAYKTTLEYSVDGGEYKTAASFFAEEDDVQPVTIEANGKVYQFRLTVQAWSEGKIITFVEESPVYQRFMSVDSIEADDNQPVDIYTLDGKLVAKKMLPSDAKTRLANGTYIAGGKKMVINK